VLVIPACAMGLRRNPNIFGALLRERPDPVIEAAHSGSASQMTRRARRELLLIRLSGGAAGADGRRAAAALLVPA
jgi:hypothetical protein